MVEAPLDQSGYYEVPTSYAVDPAPNIATVPSAALNNVATNAAANPPANTATTPADALVEAVKQAAAESAPVNAKGGNDVGSLFSNPLVIAALVLGAALVFRGK